MEHKYHDLRDMLATNEKIREYYRSLPQYAQEMIGARSGNIKSEDELRRYAENCLQGDK
jgi:hypothetical protein